MEFKALLIRKNRVKMPIKSHIFLSKEETSRYKYDSWGRLRQLIYPDEEVVDYT